VIHDQLTVEEDMVSLISPASMGLVEGEYTGKKSTELAMMNYSRVLLWKALAYAEASTAESKK